MGRDELASWLRLLLTPGIGPVSARKLLAAFGLPEAIFGHSASALRAVVGPQATQALLIEPDGLPAAVQRLQTWLDESAQRHVITLGDAHYPPDLLDLADPPLLLYVVGQLDALQHPRRLAVVGSRNPTPSGAAHARLFARALAEAGVCVVSGLALGVDAAAHEGALEADAPTLAVVGTGLDRVYPKNHHTLAHRIAARGALISEYALGTPPLPPNFPQRNRIIAALTQGTLVVEAAVQSGSLITARLAAELGREVFAIPGSINAPQARGCHALIRQGAKLVESAQDVLEDLRLRPTTPPAQATPASTPMSDDTDTTDPLLQAMGYDPVSLDSLQARTGLPTPTLQAQLLTLELDGLLTRLPGGLLQRCARG